LPVPAIVAVELLVAGVLLPTRDADAAAVDTGPTDAVGAILR
jgi:hypothetical protein